VTKSPPIGNRDAATDSANPFSEGLIARLWASYDPKSFQREELLAEEHVLARSGHYTVFFGPLGAWPDAAAKAILVGLTPGYQQLEAAARLFSQTSAEVRSDEPRRAPKMYHLWAVENVPGIGGQLKVYQSR